MYRSSGGNPPRMVNPVNAAEAEYDAAEHAYRDAIRARSGDEFLAGRADEAHKLACAGRPRSRTMPHGRARRTLLRTHGRPKCWHRSGRALPQHTATQRLLLRTKSDAPR